MKEEGMEERVKSPVVAEPFRKRFGAEPSSIVRAPGRVNLIGEHTDYNDGFVLPMAIDREVRIALRKRADGRVRVYSIDLRREAEFDLDELRDKDSANDKGSVTDKGSVNDEVGAREASRGHSADQVADGAGSGKGSWIEYLKGVAWALLRENRQLSGFDGVISGNVPRGSGLSSSAALELATARAFWKVSDFPWQPAAVARACQRAENHWLGVSTGIMDQLVSAAAQAGNALLIDCRTLDTEAVPLPPETAVLVLDTSTRRGLVSSAYNERREQCEQAARSMGVRSLRDVTPAGLDEAAGTLEPVLLKRARHVVTENRRTRLAAEAMHRQDAGELGRLMNLSHFSLRDDFEVSSPALDAIAACARSLAGCYGARLTGAGFGGCAVALVHEAAASDIASTVVDCYRAATNKEAEVYLCRAAEGAGDVSSDED